MRKLLFSLCLLPLAAIANGIERIEPPFWWVGMQHSQLQLMVYGKNIAASEVSVKHPGVTLKEIHSVDSPNYLFIDLQLDAGLAAGDIPLMFKGTEGVVTRRYTLRERREQSAQREGFSAKDVIYLITPDRFANGDPANDQVTEMEEAPDRSHYVGRHGGDLQGIIDHLDYLHDLGITQLWINPLLENAMPSMSYHGYAITNLYRIDPRFGDNALYRRLSHEAQRRGIGLIMDFVSNHIGSEHPWMHDMPTQDWINQGGEFVGTNHRRESHQDPYAAQFDQSHMTKGWFVPTMPDMNQQNAFLSTYLIQNAIWWIEYADLSGLRVDTWPYNDKSFMKVFMRRLLAEYPKLNIVGEEWSMNPAVVSYWQQDKKNHDGFELSLPSLMDFPLYQAFTDALNEEETWGTGLIKIYQMLANDFLYPNPKNLVVIADNHDMARIFTRLEEDNRRFEMAMIFLLTVRGIPQIFYGTEILMSHPGTDEHGIIRSDFPGGWAGDQVNGFTGEGLTKPQRDAQIFLKKLLNWRKSASAIHTGNLKHFAPVEGVYVYFRYNDTQKIMVAMNNHANAQTLDMQRYAEILTGETQAYDVLKGETAALDKPLSVPSKTAVIYELR